MVEAEATIERLAAVPANDGLVVHDIWLLRLQALVTRAYGDDAAYTHFRDGYRDMARTLGFEGPSYSTSAPIPMINNSGSSAEPKRW